MIDVANVSKVVLKNKNATTIYVAKILALLVMEPDC